MEFGTREILIVLGIVIILGILLDGLRRVKQARNGSLKISRRKHAIFDDVDDISGELPGKVRVIRRDEQSAEEVSDNIKRNWQNTGERYTSAFRQRTPDESRSGRVSDNLCDEPSDDKSGEYDFAPEEYDDRQAHHAQHQAPDQNPYDDEPATDQNETDEEDARWVASRDDDDIPVRAEPFHLAPQEEPPLAEEPARRKPFWQEKPAPSQPAAAATPARPAPAPQPARESRRASSQSDEVNVIVLHIMAKKEGHFEGALLLDALLGNGLRYGDMGIFHRHEMENGSGPLHFSLANSVKPGTFDLSAMESFSTPGLTLFMPLEGLNNPLESFAQLVKTAQSLAKTLGGELKDETRSVLTKQTIEHHRQQIIEYTRRSFTLSH